VRRDRLAFAQELHRRTTVRVAPEVLVHGAGLGDRVKGGVDHCTADLAPDDLVLTTVDGCPLDTASTELGVEVARERVDGLVVVVVRIEGWIPELHVRLLGPNENVFSNATTSVAVAHRVRWRRGEPA
jgi:hypothetical protein